MRRTKLTLAFFLALVASAASSPLLGVEIPGEKADTIQFVALNSALRRVAEGLGFSCRPGTEEVYVLPKSLTAAEVESLEKSLKGAGWEVEREDIGATRVWLLQRWAFGKQASLVVVEGTDGEKVFLGACRPL
ncbi:hypothetical protein [Thermus thermophilus]|uniref:Uncharacterized protein n=1 Tax=Thermus thermophilus TaxID=274 RepID=A0A7R7YIC9_THETH|nr:hypothetical protein [Thermus thermophilus]BCP66173.1 hypothetical protein TthHB5018_11070 [Thermus thermophilus]